MAINFTNDVFPLWATNVITDAEYLAVDPARRNDPFEQSLLTLVETMRAFMAELGNDEQARMFHYTISRMLAATAYNKIYSGDEASITGNNTGIAVSATNGDTVTITTASGSDAVVLGAGPFADLDAVVADINGQIAAAVEVEAYTVNGVLGFQNTAGNIGVSFVLTYPVAATSLLVKAGIDAGTVLSTTESVANGGRDDALAHFERVSNPITP